jgi:hypothetical protein
VFLNYHLTGYQAVFVLVASIGLVGAVVSTALRNYRFHADGTRVGEAVSTFTSAGHPVSDRPAVDASPTAGGVAR